MADIEVYGFDSFLTKMDKLGDYAYVVNTGRKMVDAAYTITESAMKSAIASVEYGPYATRSVSESVSGTGTRINSYGVYAVARPTGYDDKAVRNGLKAAFLQYGTSQMAARPWREKALNTAKGPAIKTMEQVMRSEMGLE